MRVLLNNDRTGQYYDQESGLSYNPVRYYEPHTGRYVSKHPIGLADRLNEYAYVNGNPIQAIDPLGLKTAPVLLGLGNVYRAGVMHPMPTMVKNATVGSALGEMSNFPWPVQQVPGEWVGVNVESGVTARGCPESLG
jgi:type VI secretion system secreted protein VgrG